MPYITPVWHWVISHPYECLLLIGAFLSFINGLLPAKVAAGPVGKVLHEILDRLSVLTRTDSPGTLKWPVVGTSLIQPPAAPTPPAQESK